jgi:hypothetical protein
MSEPPNFYAKVRAEVLGLLGWKSDDSLSPDAVMKVDLCVSLRLAIDDMNGRLARGEQTDVTKLLAAADALARYLPPPRNPPTLSHEVDPRETMWKVYSEMRERGELAERQMEPSLRTRIAELEAENALLRAGAPAAPASPMPPAGNVLTLSRSSPKNAPVASAAPSPPEYELRVVDEPWRTSSAYTDPWANRNF